MLDCCEPAWKLDKLPKFLTAHRDTEGVQEGCKDEQQLQLPSLRTTWSAPFTVGAKTGPARAKSRVQPQPLWCASANAGFGNQRQLLPTVVPWMQQAQPRLIPPSNGSASLHVLWTFWIQGRSANFRLTSQVASSPGPYLRCSHPQLCQHRERKYLPVPLLDVAFPPAPCEPL